MRGTKVIWRILTSVTFLFCLVLSAEAGVIDQWANSVIDYSSQYDSGAWSAAQALGAPDTFDYGDIVTAWAPEPDNGTLEYITLGYSTPVYASSITIRETCGNGFVYRVDILDQSNVLHTVWTGTDPSLPGNPADFLVSFAETPFLVTGVKIYTDTNHDLDTWEEIDAVQLLGSTTHAPVPPTLFLLGSGLAGLVGWRRFRKS
ncbi:MAG: hypothetical protein A2139_02590 [Desulfobacca sp. RBG_16_60_12]|nr:MAG: hypothetical protein A2139_02590 [Desulfobacca sp. RBG_16_60_12]